MTKRLKLNAVQILSLGFAGLILTGGLLLSLPLASRSGVSLPLLDAFFTAASASCVTGLVLYDTWTQFSFFGQLVILLLIQIGGLGFMTVSILVSVLLKRRIGLHRRVVLMDSVGALQMGGIVRLTRRALKVTVVCEGSGAVLLALWFCPRYGLLRGSWMAVFHAVSAFCNAGFDLLGTGGSLVDAAGEPLLNLVLMALIICGGMGFLVWDDLLTHGRQFRFWRLHSKIVAVSTALLFLLGTVGFCITERRCAFSGASGGEMLLMAAFQSVTARTAGFNTVDMRALSESGTLLMMVLMFVGAGSGSTGGGVKVNTISAILLSSFANVRQKRDAEIFCRRLDEETVRKAYTSVSVYLAAGLVGCMILCLGGVELTDAAFEVTSALGTVGLTRGLTPSLSTVSRLVVILLMYAGRVGSMSVAMAITRDRPQPKLRKVPEKILIG